jgi:hypothetical protein
MINQSELVSATCPVCSNGVAARFFSAGHHPIATLAWPQTAEEAQAMPEHPHDYVQCPQCTHVWNHSFSYDAIPYQSNPNRMYNKGGAWVGHLAQTRDLVLTMLPENPTVADIGCGEGHFVRGLAQALDGNGTFLGFDPNSSPESGKGLEFRAEYFHPLTDMAKYRPNAVVIRHVLEHLTHPAAFIDQFAWGAEMIGDQPAWMFVEVPCIDRVMPTERLADFFYEHMSHFTTASFQRLMERAGTIMELGHGYNGEVVYALVRLHARQVSQVIASSEFSARTESSRQRISDHLNDLVDNGKRIAVWGGTGKGAFFINLFGLDAERFPMVVDSDITKAGTYVPGTGQEIQYRDVLKISPVDIVIIPTQWRSRDIEAEMAREGISVEDILIEHQGDLVSLRSGNHPYS